MEEKYSNFRFFFTKLLVFIALLIVMLKAYPSDNIEKKVNSPKPVPESVSSPKDTIYVPRQIRQRLENPTYDIRFNKGSIKPWHDRKSIYIKRMILMSTLA
ncbi:MAG: hypothetical protein ACOCYO_05180 [Bacteroidota bacterium]